MYVDLRLAHKKAIIRSLQYVLTLNDDGQIHRFNSVTVTVGSLLHQQTAYHIYKAYYKVRTWTVLNACGFYAGANLINCRNILDLARTHLPRLQRASEPILCGY